MQVYVSVRSHTEYRHGGNTTMVIFDLFYLTSDGPTVMLRAYSSFTASVMGMIYEWLDQNCEYKKCVHLKTAVRVKSGGEAALIMLRYHETLIDVGRF